MLLRYLSILIIGMLLLLNACTDLFEPSLAEEKITVHTPLPNAKTTSYSPTFWWESLPSALTYQLQIVSPRFDSVASLRLDTVIKKNKFTISLTPGPYQWRIRALNGSSQTLYFTYSLQVDTADLASQAVLVNLPQDNAYVKTARLSFQWQSLFGAKKYRLQIDTANFEDETAFVLDYTTTALSYSYTLPKENTYQWRVRAEKEATLSQWSETRTLIYDKTPPDSVALTSPLPNAVDQPTSVTLKWEAGENVSKYNVYIYKTTATNLVATQSTTETSYSYTGAKGESIFWRVRAVDAAGNESVAGQQRKFTIQP